MDIKEELQKDSSPQQVESISDYVLGNPETFDELMQCFFSEDFRLAHWASNVVIKCVKKQNKWIDPYLERIVKDMEKPGAREAKKRNCVRLLQFVELPEKYMGDVADTCFKFLDSAKEAIAVRAFSMTVLYNITKTYPEIKNELIMMIEDHLPYGSAGIKSRGRNILKQLKKN